MKVQIKVQIKIPVSDSGNSDQYPYNGLTGYLETSCGLDKYDPNERIFIELTKKSREKISEYNKAHFSQYRCDPGIYRRYLVKVSSNIVISNE